MSWAMWKTARWIQGYRFPGKSKYQQKIEDEELLQYKLPVLTIRLVI